MRSEAKPPRQIDMQVLKKALINCFGKLLHKAAQGAESEAEANSPLIPREVAANGEQSDQASAPAAQLGTMRSCKVYGLILGANLCEWVSWNGARIALVSGESFDPSQIYEARFFGNNKQLIFRRVDGKFIHRSASVGAKPVANYTSPNSYLLWGKLADDGNASSRELSTLPRGRMSVPKSGRGGRVIHLSTQEVIGKDKSGNCYVKGEVWTEFEVLKESTMARRIRQARKPIKSPQQKTSTGQ